jgi:hypothetical protein
MADPTAWAPAALQHGPLDGRTIWIARNRKPALEIRRLLCPRCAYVHLLTGGYYELEETIASFRATGWTVVSATYRWTPDVVDVDRWLSEAWARAYAEAQQQQRGAA